ncbi:MAG TPA: ribosome silencing factor [Gaiellaceae bacterium]|nr:ribosome silencing factor [Gaiellaceae bacterium]
MSRPRSRARSSASASIALPCRPRGAAKLRANPKGRIPTLTSLEQARRIAALAQEKLAEDVMILDLRPVTAYTDFFVLATGRNARQTKAIYDEVRERMKADERARPRAVEGEREGNWIVADYLDVVLHIFTPDTREYYGLEDLWGDMPSVELASA